MSKWIKCSERMPDAVRTVLFYGMGRTHFGYLSTETRAWVSRSADASYDYDRVTHWQPLPEPPAEDE